MQNSFALYTFIYENIYSEEISSYLFFIYFFLFLFLYHRVPCRMSLFLRRIVNLKVKKKKKNITNEEKGKKTSDEKY